MTKSGSAERGTPTQNVEHPMKTVTTSSPASPQFDDDMRVPDNLIGRLHHATESSVIELMHQFTPHERANLAMFCYHKCHLRQIGLAIAATCDLPALVQVWGTVLGQALFAQSRERSTEPYAVRVQHRHKITLARSAGRIHPPLIDLEDMPQSA
jgi:hypothetical protein